MKRRQIKVSDRYGKTTSGNENIKERMLNSPQEFRELYKSFSNDTRKRVSYEEGMEQARKIADSTTTRTLDEEKMLLRSGKDKPIKLNEFIRLVKYNLNSNLVLIPNNLIGDNVGGNCVYLLTNEGLKFICGVGKNLDNIIYPETTFFEATTNEGTHKKIKARGYLAAYEQIVSWLQQNQFPVRNRNFINEG